MNTINEQTANVQLNQENWLPIASINGYEVSDLGNVRSLKTLNNVKIQTSNGVQYFVTKGTSRKLAKLVADTFLKKNNSIDVVDFIDLNPLNCVASNLYYRSNKKHNVMCNLSLEVKNEIKKLKLEGVKLTNIASTLNVSIYSVRTILGCDKIKNKQIKVLKEKVATVKVVELDYMQTIAKFKELAVINSTQDYAMMLANIRYLTLKAEISALNSATINHLNDVVDKYEAKFL